MYNLNDVYLFLIGSTIGQIGGFIYVWKNWNNPNVESVFIWSALLCGWFIGILALCALPFVLGIYVPIKILNYLRPKN